MERRLALDPDTIQSNTMSHATFPTALIDQKIEAELWKLRKARFFVEFDTVRSALALARGIAKGELSGGTDATRCRGLAWCVRFLSRSAEFQKAEEYLELAKELGTCPEIVVAQAFVLSQRDGKRAGLKALAHTDSALSRTAALMIVSHHENTEDAVEWLKEANVTTENLCPDGKYFLLSQQLELGRWNAAKEIVDSLTDRDTNEAPVLHHAKAITHLLGAIPIELRRVVLTQVPIEAARFPLASDELGISARRTAHRHFLNAVKAAKDLDCHDMAMESNDFALWLELRDPQQIDLGKMRLKEMLRDKKSALRVVHLGIQFELELDAAAVEKEIDKQVALHGEISRDAALARFALAFTSKSPEMAANYVAHHYEDLAKHMNTKALRFLQVELYSKAGLPNKAMNYLESLLIDGLTEFEEAHLRGVVGEAEGLDLVETLEQQFKTSESLGDLISLVQELQERQDWQKLCDFARVLFERTKSVHDAERLATALSNTNRTNRLVEFIQCNSNLLVQSRPLGMLYAWALYHEGELIESRSELSRLDDGSDDPNCRALQKELGVALGDRDTLNSLVANDYQCRDSRSAHELIKAAQLALRLESPHFKGLVFSAAERGEDDALVLANAYFLASCGGWEDNEHVTQWLIDAAELSGEEGPLRTMSLKDILDLKPEWERRESHSWKMLSDGELPLFLAARSLNSSLVDLTLFPAFANQKEQDPRKRHIIPCYSGARHSLNFDPGAVTVGMDATALVTLAFLNLLDRALDAFKVIYVPHSTMEWLFEEKQRAIFHQPSRLRDSHQIRDLIATEEILQFVPSTLPDSDLAAQIGDGLASLIAEAENVRDNDTTQRIVVRSSPIHRLSSLMEEEADLTAHAPVLSSCIAVVEKLRQCGQLTSEEEKRARSFLQLREKPWPNQPAIADGAVLYLDDLSISYFLHLGILEKINSAGLIAIASIKEISEANALIAFESIAKKVRLVIEYMQTALSSRIESGSIKVGRRLQIDESDELSMSEHPTAAVFGLASCCDVVLVDDRFLNRHAHIEEGKSQTQVGSTIDLLDALTDSGIVSMDERLELRTLLRQAGYALVPVSVDETIRYLNESEIRDNQVTESAELKSVRESVLKLRMNDWLQLPYETHWLQNTVEVFVHAIKKLWLDGANPEEATARSNWLVDLIDMRGWAHRFGVINGDDVVRLGPVAYIQVLLIPPVNVSRKMREAYWEWIENRILVPIQEQYPELYSSLVDLQRVQIATIAESKPSE